MDLPFAIGQGFDVHALVPGRALIIGGVAIPHDRGLLGHSDADVLLHAITDALLGAAALGDIGRHFPDTDPRYEGADSRELLAVDWSGAQRVVFRGLGGNVVLSADGTSASSAAARAMLPCSQTATNRRSDVESSGLGI